MDTDSKLGKCQYCYEEGAWQMRCVDTTDIIPVHDDDSDDDDDESWDSFLADLEVDRDRPTKETIIRTISSPTAIIKKGAAGKLATRQSPRTPKPTVRFITTY